MKQEVAKTICILVCGKAGSGKCFRKDTEIILFDGSFKKVQDVVVGDVLMGDDSSPRFVLELYRGKEDIFQISPMKGDPFYVTGNHILVLVSTNKTVYDHGKFIKLIPNYTIEVSVNDYLKRYAYYNKRFKLYHCSVDFNSQSLPLDPYFLGLWLGDGTSDRPAITTMDEEVKDYIYSIANEYGMKVRVTKGDNNKSSTYYISNGKTGGKKPNKILNTLRDLNLSHNKHIPSIYKINSRDNRLKLLAGLLDSDGYLSNNFFNIVQKSEELSKDICYLARSLGFMCTSHKVTKTIKSTGFSGIYVNINLSGDFTVLPLKVPRRIPSKRLQIKNPLVTGIKSITNLGIEEYYGFSVDKNNRILMSDFLVTHNSTSAIFLKKEFESKGYTVEIARFASGVKATSKFMGWDGEKDCKGRKLLQGVGGVGREYDKDCWVSLTFNEILPKSVNFPQDIVIVDDYRFPNESEFVKNTSMYQVFEVRIESPDREMLKGTPEYDDISETSLPSGEDTRYHRTIYNLGSLEDLDEKCKVLALDVEQKSDMW